jgi:anti-sigma factor RsiW
MNQQISGACSWRGDLAAYLVGALDPRARTAVRSHLGLCPPCHAEYKELAPVVRRLAQLRPRLQPAREVTSRAAPGRTSTGNPRDLLPRTRGSHAGGCR